MAIARRRNNRPSALLALVLTAAMLASIAVLVPGVAEAQTINKAVALSNAPAEFLGVGTDPKLSDSGRFVAWVGPGSTAPTRSRDYDQIFYHDRDTGTTTLVSQFGGVEGNAQSLEPQITDDGRYVAFSSKASNLDPADTDSRPDVYLADMVAGTLSVISPDDGANHVGPVLSGDGTMLLYNTQMQVEVGDGVCDPITVNHHSIVAEGAPFSAPTWPIPASATKAKALDRTGAVLGYDVDGVTFRSDCSRGEYVSESVATTGTFDYAFNASRDSEVADISADGRTMVIKDTEKSAWVIDLTTGTVLHDWFDFSIAGPIADDRTVMIRSGAGTGIVDLTTGDFLSAAGTPRDMNADGTIVVAASSTLASPASVTVIDVSTPPTETCFGLTATIVGSGTIIGTTGDDVIVGSDGPDYIRSLGGNDTICAAGGDDYILASSGNDMVSAGDGEDKIFGALGNDTIYGGDGADEIDGGKGDDDLFGDDGDDELDGGPNNDRLIGGDGADVLVGGFGKDTVTYIDSTGPVEVRMDDIANDGQASENDNIDSSVESVVGTVFNDTLIGSSKANTLRGLAGDDVIRGGGGRDLLFGGSGDDEIRGGGADDELDGGVGTDFCRGGTGTDTFMRCETEIQ